MITTPSSIVLGGAGIFKKGITQLGGVANLNLIIKQLFANSEQGFTQTLDDYSILFQDALGKNIATGSSQTLGLVLDKSKGLVVGSNVSAISSASKTVDGSQIDYLLNNATYANKWHVIEFDVLSVTSQPLINISGASTFYFDTNTIGVGHSKLMILANSSGQIKISGSPTSRYSIANITVKNISGSHAYQTTSSMRPLLQNNPLRVQYDGIDDKLTTTLPAQLTGCTVIRAIPNVGCQILTNQTIPTPYNDSTSHCGLIVINRALTAYETSLVTQIFNKLAGV